MSDGPEAPRVGGDPEQVLEAAAREHRAGRLELAEALYLQVLAAAPGHGRATHNLGALHLQMKRVSQALPLLAAATRAEPEQPQYWVTYVHGLTASGQFEAAQQAVASCRARGLRAEIDAVELRLNQVWVQALNAQGRYAEGEAKARRAVELAPDSADAHADLGFQLTVLAKLDAAEASYRRALALEPENFQAGANLASTLRRLQRYDEAEAIYRRALALRPDDLATLKNLAALLKDRGQLQAAKALYRQAAPRDPSLETSVQAHLGLTHVTASLEDIAGQRADYARGLEAFAADPRTFRYDGERNQLSWFSLAYHGRDDRELLERTAELFAAKVEDLRYVSPRLAGWRAPEKGQRRIRVAVVSDFLHDHTIGRLYRGLIERLDRTRFEVALVHGPHGRRDAMRTELDGAADASITLGARLGEQRAAIEALAPDVLFYPDIGMSAPTYYLAFSRLAPVQAVSWGHPDTTGVKSLDYFISAASIEPEGAQAFYTERLVELERLPCFYERPQVIEPAPSREALGLPAEGVLYGCPQTPFKFHPDFDAVLAEIAAGDPDGWILIAEASQPLWMEALKARWRERHPILLERVAIVPRLSPERFVAHLGHVDVLLDPLHFGSGNTLYEAMAHGTPIVTCPGAFARSRIVQGAYRQMGVAEAPVADRVEDYAPLALALGRDSARRLRLRSELQAAAKRGLYADALAIRAFEDFLGGAIEAAGRRSSGETA